MSLGATDLLKRLAELGYFHSTKFDPELFRSLVADQLHMEPHQALQMLVNAGYVEMDHGPNTHPISHPDRWRLTLTNRGLTALLEG
jgi:hypothetical protein